MSRIGGGVGSGTSWRGMDGEDEMTDADWLSRAQDQGLAALHAGDPFASSPDAEGTATGGCYNGDYPDSWHDEQNARLDADEYFEAETGAQLNEIQHYQSDS
jgi:hypothetical protein